MAYKLHQALFYVLITTVGLYGADDDIAADLIASSFRFHSGNEPVSLLTHTTSASLAAAFVPSALGRIVNTANAQIVTEQIALGSPYLILNQNSLAYETPYEKAEIPASFYGARSRYLVLFPQASAEEYKNALVAGTIEYVKNRADDEDIESLFADLPASSGCPEKAFALFDLHAYLVALNPNWRNDWPTVCIKTDDGVEFISKEEFARRKRNEKIKIGATTLGAAALIAGGAAYKSGSCTIQ